MWSPALAWSCGRGGFRPSLMGLGPEKAKIGPMVEVGLEIEGVVDWGVGGEEVLGGALVFELLLHAPSSSDSEVAVLGSVVRPHATGPMAIGEAEIAGRRPVGAKFIRRDRLRMDHLVLEQLAKQLQRRMLIASLPDQHV